MIGCGNIGGTVWYYTNLSWVKKSCDCINYTATAQICCDCGGSGWTEIPVAPLTERQEPDPRWLNGIGPSNRQERRKARALARKAAACF